METVSRAWRAPTACDRLSVCKDVSLQRSCPTIEHYPDYKLFWLLSWTENVRGFCQQNICTWCTSGSGVFAFNEVQVQIYEKKVRKSWQICLPIIMIVSKLAELMLWSFDFILISVENKSTAGIYWEITTDQSFLYSTDIICVYTVSISRKYNII